MLLLLKVLEVVLVVWVVAVAWSMFRTKAALGTGKAQARRREVSRFNTEGEDISDAEYKEVK
jgi:hypothetical protein